MVPQLTVSSSSDGLQLIVQSPDPIFNDIISLREVLSPVFDIRATSALSESVEICMKVTSDAESQKKDRCLGFIDESRSPPRWTCEDECLEENSDGLLCGKTKHFTNFAILLGATGGDCDDFDYITGSMNGDLILVASIVAFIVAIACFILACSYLKPGKVIIYGKRGIIAKAMRKDESSVVILKESD